MNIPNYEGKTPLQKAEEGGQTEIAALLRASEIACLIDVRSMPASRRYPQFDKHELERNLTRAGIAYRFLGDRLSELVEHHVGNKNREQNCRYHKEVRPEDAELIFSLHYFALLSN